MGIAGDLFWIAAGIIYVIYRGIKEEPEITIPILIIVPPFVGGIVLFGSITKWLMRQNIMVGAVFSLGVIGLCSYFLARFQYKERLKRQKRQSEYTERMNIVRSSLTEQDYEEYARNNAYRFYANMNPCSFMYWKNEPYYSRIKAAAVLQRSIDMREDEYQRKDAY